MAIWDELCILCGICPGGGALRLLHRSQLEQIASQITDDLTKHNFKISLLEGDESICDIVKTGLAASFEENDRSLDYRAFYRPEGLSEWRGFKTCIAIGYFDYDDEPYFSAPLPLHSLRGGHGVEVRRVRECNSGDFQTWVKQREPEPLDEEGEEAAVGEEDEGSEDWNEKEEYIESRCSTQGGTHPNIFLSEVCYHYMEAWLEWTSFPARSVAFPHDTEQMSFAGELYEIVASREQCRGPRYIGLVPSINYDGIETTVDQTQINYINGRSLGSAPRAIATAIQGGLRGRDLIPAIMNDCRAWMFMRPDLWPAAPSSLPPIQSSGVQQNPQPGLPRSLPTLPQEILLGILTQLPLASYLALSSTCKVFRDILVTSHVLADQYIHDCIHEPSGFLKWVLPVPGMKGEVHKAETIANAWLALRLPDPEAKPEDFKSTTSPFKAHGFPHWEFVKACYASDSMTNRKRIWGLVKQYDRLWIDYRTKGWEREVFKTRNE